MDLNKQHEENHLQIERDLQVREELELKNNKVLEVKSS